MRGSKGEGVFPGGPLLLAAALFLAAAGPALAETPLEAVKATNQRVLDLLAANPVVDAKVEEKLFGIIDPATDFDGIAGSVVDGFCPKLTPAQCAEFKRTFTRLLRVSSIRKLGRYRADKFDYLGEEAAGETATVKTGAWYKKERIALDYSLARRGARWIIVNYTVEGVDTIRNYKKQFTRLLAQGTFEAMLARLKAKIAEYEKEE